MEELQATLIRWFATHQRELPWRSHPTPYYVWLSEVILQQTRVSQGLDYFNRFVERWPSLSDLADADEEEVLKLWQGLGYYSRARNLHKCAKEVVRRYGGALPADYEELVKLPGIGPYTAAAIASIAFGLPHAVVDGNVYRVLSRLFDIDIPINADEGVKTFASLADALLDRIHPGLHNQTMMELGALQCLPKSPNCHDCPLLSHCLSFAHGTVESRPVKNQKTKIKTRFFNYLVIKDKENHLYLRKRQQNDIWKNLYDFPSIESDHPMDLEEVISHQEFKNLLQGKTFQIARISPQYTHKLTHQTLIATFIEIKIFDFLPVIQENNLLLVSENELGKYPIPKLIDNYLNGKRKTENGKLLIPHS